jgi:hypothetical protein
MGERLMRNRAFTGIVFALLLLAGVWSEARAQQPISQGQATSQAGWMFNFAPYLWLPTANVSLDYKIDALGDRLPTDVSSGPGDYLSHFDAGLAFAADARNGPFSLLTDFLYTRFSVDKGANHIKSVDFFNGPSIPISRESQTSVSTTLKTAIWTLAGGYTLLQGDWGNLDLFVGFRLLVVDATTDFAVAVRLTGPSGNGATFGGIGGASASKDIWNGIGGLRGRVRIGTTPWFIPYYFDIGGGGSQLTWQIASGVGYQIRWAALSATYRYLSFEQRDEPTVKHMALRGPMLMVNFSF